MDQPNRTAMGMLQEIPSETAQQLFNAVHFQTDPPGSTMLTELDKHLVENCEAASVVSSLNRGDVIEIQGPAASGKTQLLYHLAACCILPTDVFVNSINDQAGCIVHLGGWHKSTVVLDCDGRWDTRRLHKMLVTRLNSAFSKTQLPPLPHKADTTVSSISLSALSRLHVFRPTSSLQLVATLLNLPKYHAEQMPNEEIKLLFVDSISSFYWADKWQAEPSGSKKFHRPNPLWHVLHCLQTFRLSHGPVTVLTNWGLNPLPSTMFSAPSAPFFRQHLPAPFPAPLDEPPRRPLMGEPNPLPLTCHITLPFRLVSQSQPDIGYSDNLDDHEGGGLEEALFDERRTEVVERGEIGAYVRIPHIGREQDLAPRSVVGKFRFRILEHDVVGASA